MKGKRGVRGVSIITCTKRFDCLLNLFGNYGRQTYKNKELIVIVNHRKPDMRAYKNAAESYPNVRIYSLPEHVSLGRCLNYGVNVAKHDLVAKFDDDDYYAPDYLADSVRSLVRTNADIVGKRTHFMYLRSRKLLLLRYPHKALKFVPLVQGATLLVKRRVFGRVRFPDRNRGESIRFCADSRTKGFRIYSGTKHHFAAIRRPNSAGHTWIVSDKSLLSGNVKVFRVKDYRSFVSRGLRKP